jgi:hypothetical protein
MTAERKDRIRKLVKEIQDIEDAKNELCRRKRAVSQQAKAELGYGDSDFDAIEEVLLALWGPVSVAEPELTQFPNEDLISVERRDNEVITVVPQEWVSFAEDPSSRDPSQDLPPVPKAVYEALKRHGPMYFHELEDLLPNIGFGASAGLSHLSRKGLAVKKEDGIWRAL